MMASAARKAGALCVALVSITLAACRDDPPAATMVVLGSAASVAAPVPSSSAAPSPEPVAAPDASTEPTPDGAPAPPREPTDAELEALLVERAQKGLAMIAYTRCQYRNQDYHQHCPRPSIEGKSVYQLDKDFQDALARITDEARRKAWKKAWTRAANESVVVVPGAPAASPR